MQLNSPSIHVAFISLIGSYDASGRRSSLGTLPQFRQEGSEPWLRRRSRTRRRCRSNLAARALVLGLRVGFVFREAQRSDFKKPAAALFVRPKRPSRFARNRFPIWALWLSGRAYAPQPLIPSGSSLRASAPPGRGSSFLAAVARRRVSTNLHHALAQGGLGPHRADSGCR